MPTIARTANETVPYEFIQLSIAADPQKLSFPTRIAVRRELHASGTA